MVRGAKVNIWVETVSCSIATAFEYPSKVFESPGVQALQLGKGNSYLMSLYSKLSM